MKLDKREWSLLTIGVCALLFLIGFAIGDHYDPQYHANAYTAQEKENGRIVGLTSDQWTLAFTAMLTVVAIIQLFQLNASNRTAANALTEAKEASRLTKKSVDAFISAERGRASLVKAWMDIDAKGQRRVTYEFLNIGQSVMFVRGIALDIAPAKGITLKRDIQPSFLWNRYVPPGGTIAHDKVKGPEGELVPPECYKIDGTIHNVIVVQFEAVIQTLDQWYRYHGAWMFTAKGLPGLTNEGSTRYPDSRFEYDEPFTPLPVTI